MVTQVANSRIFNFVLLIFNFVETFSTLGVIRRKPHRELAFRVKNHVDTSKNLKAYIVIFVCGTTRSIHLELLNNMETEVFLQGSCRFVS